MISGGRSYGGRGPFNASGCAQIFFGSTAFSALLVCVALFTLGGPTVHSFSVTLIVGVIVATYSSIYVSTSLAVALGVSREDLLPPKLDENVDKMP